MPNIKQNKINLGTKRDHQFPQIFEDINKP